MLHNYKTIRHISKRGNKDKHQNISLMEGCLRYCFDRSVRNCSNFVWPSLLTLCDIRFLIGSGHFSLHRKYNDDHAMWIWYIVNPYSCTQFLTGLLLWKNELFLQKKDAKKKGAYHEQKIRVCENTDIRIVSRREDNHQSNYRNAWNILEENHPQIHQIASSKCGKLTSVVARNIFGVCWSL